MDVRKNTTSVRTVPDVHTQNNVKRQIKTVSFGSTVNTAMHQEVIENLESIQGALLRMNRSIQAEGTFGIIKNDRWYKRIVRRGIKSVLLEVFLVSIGHNLYKYHNKQKKVATAA